MPIHALRALVLILGCGLFWIAAARTDPSRRPPTEELARLAPFLGTWSTTMDQGSRRLHGTMEVRPIVNGWYVERVNRSRSEDGSIDSEIRSLITWDPAMNRYRIWRFVQLIPLAKHDGLGWFEGDDFVEHYEFPDAPPHAKVLRNRTTPVSPVEVRTVNEVGATPQSMRVRGVITARRIAPPHAP